MTQRWKLWPVHESDGAPVPARYRGVWTRTLLETPEVRDDTTFVRWLQLGRWHADLRIPLVARAGLGGVLHVIEIWARRGLAEGIVTIGR